jgi:hypothetical protein
MADFLSRLAARTLGVAPTAQPSITPMFAQERMQAEHDSLESWVEAESPGDWEPQPGPFVQNGMPPLARQVPPSLPLVAQRGLSPASPVQPSADSYNIDVNADVIVETTHPQHAVFTTSTVEQAESMASLPMTRRNDLVPARSTSHATFGEDRLAVQLEQTLTSQPVEPASLPSERSATGGTLGQRPAPGIVGLSPALMSHTLVPRRTIQAGLDGTPPQDSNRSSRRRNGLPDSLQETTAEAIVEQERGVDMPPRPTPGMQQRPLAAPLASAHQFIAPSRADTLKAQPSAPLPHGPITAGAVHAQPVAHNQQVIEAQWIEQPAPAPTIQVTIGRIEVRATPPPPAPPQSQQRSTPPIMSLDQYLQQRSKGGDR